MDQKHTTHRRQDRAVVRALELAEADGRVDVFGPEEQGSLLSNERTCDQPNAEQPVVYHVDVKPMPGAEWATPCCSVARRPTTEGLPGFPMTFPVFPHADAAQVAVPSV